MTSRMRHDSYVGGHDSYVGGHDLYVGVGLI